MIRDIKVRDTHFSKGRPLVCVPVSGSSTEEVIWEIESTEGADVIEWRADFFAEDIHSALAAVRNACGETPLLVTYRTKAEGGKADVSQERYEETIKKLITSGRADLIDIEFSSSSCEELIKYAKEHSVITVVSSHDFEKTDSEDELVQKLNDMEAAGADLPKIAQMPRSFRDTLNMISATERVSQINFPIITMSMGKYGKVSRVCGEFSGSALTFGASKIASAPGQLKVGLLNQILDEMSK